MSKSKIINSKPSELKEKLKFSWTEISKLIQIVIEANQRYDFGLSEKDISNIENVLKDIPKQPDSFMPIFLTVWPNGKFEDNIRKIFQWAADRAMECEGIDINCGLLKDLIDGKMNICNSLFNYDEQGATVRVDTIDIKNSRIECFFVDSIISAPLGIEIWSFIACHPQFLKLLNGNGIGNLKVPGLKFCVPNSNVKVSPILSVKDKKMSIFCTTEK